MSTKTLNLLAAIVLLAASVSLFGYAVSSLPQGEDFASMRVPIQSQLAQVAAPTSGMVGHWAFDEAAGAVAADSSGNSHAATLTGAGAWGPGKIGNALQFSGTNAVTAANPTTATDNITLATWVNWADTSASTIIFYNGHPGGNGYGLYISNGGLSAGNTINVLLGGVTVLATNAVLPTGSWTHVAFVRESGTWKFYKDGLYVKNIGTQSPHTPSTGAGYGVTLGSFNGSLDDARLYSRALSGAEVAQLYNAGVSSGGGASYGLTVSKSGQGTVTSQPAGISCGPTCSASMGAASVVTLTAAPDPGYTTTWSGCGPITVGDSCIISLSADASVSAVFIPTPVAPVISGVAVSTVGSSRATISWSTDIGADAQVEYGTSASYGSLSNLADAAFNATSHSISLSGLQPNTTYHYRARSRNQYLSLGTSAGGTFTTSAAGPDAPGYVSAKGVAPDQINLVWYLPHDDHGTVTRYTVYRDGAAVAELTAPSYDSRYPDSGQARYQDLSVSPGSTHSYHVIAHDSAGYASPASKTVSASTPGGTPALIPSDRLIDWTPGVSVGVPGGIPAVPYNGGKTINVRSAPYNADNTGASDARAAIQAAIDAANYGDVVYLPAGTYLVSSSALSLVWKSGVTLKGDGMESTIIDCRASHCINVGPNDGDAGARTPVTGGLSKGSTAITVADASSFAAGKLIKLHVADDLSLPVIAPGGSNGYLRTQVTRVASKSGNTLTIWPPLYGDYRKGAIAQLIPSHSANVGIMDLTASGGTVGIYVGQTHGFWMKNVKVVNVSNFVVMLSDSLQCEIRGSTITGLGGEGSPNHSGIIIGATNGCLVEDNIILENFPSVEINSGSNGNVFGYNYMHNANGLATIDTNHGPHNLFNLFEGNDTGFNMSDGYFGSDSHSTFFRNKMRGIALKRLSRDYNFIGNVITEGQSFGQPNIGNGSSLGIAQPSQGIYWADWNPTDGFTLRGTLIERFDVTAWNGKICPNCGGKLQVTSGTVFSGQALNGIISTPVIVSSVAGDTATIDASGYSEPPSTLRPLPAVGTQFSIVPGPGGMQELDMDVALTLIGKVNSVRGSIPSFERLPAGQSLSNSLYLSSKPAWFGNLSWPPFDPSDPTPSADAIPAAYRYHHNGAHPDGSTTPPPADTTAPVISSISAGALTTSGATITWITNEAASSQVQYGLTASYGSQTAEDATKLTVHSVALSGLAANTLYHYRVISKDAAGNTATSQGATFTTSAAPVPGNASPVVSLTSPAAGSLIKSTTVTLAAAATDTDGTISKVEFYADGTLIGTDATAPYVYDWTNIPPGKYVITVKAYDDDNASTVSAAIQVGVKGTGKPPKVENVQVAPGSIILSWTNPDYDFFDHTAIYRSTSGFPEATDADLLVTTTDASYRDRAVTPGTLYYYSIYSVDDEGELSEPVQLSYVAPEEKEWWGRLVEWVRKAIN